MALNGKLRYKSALRIAEALRRHEQLEMATDAAFSKSLNIIVGPNATLDVAVYEVLKWADINCAPDGVLRLLRVVRNENPGNLELASLETEIEKSIGSGAKPQRGIDDDEPLPTPNPLVTGPSTNPSNILSRRLKTFVGREREIGEVKEFLSREAFVTLTGIAGCGKTRLAIQIALDVLRKYQDGVWLVELGSLTEPSLLPPEVASVLKVRKEPGRPMSETLRAFLRDRSLLLLLDNCEHLLEACRELALDLLQSCPGLHILATSLQWLGEGQNYLVPTLILPPPQAAISVAAIRASEAGELFAVRAASSTRSFNLKETNAPAIAQICKRLDGLPLAIELAAARVNALPVERIAEHLRDTLLRPHPNGSRMVTRDPALQAALDWSYTCLIDRERVVLRRLSTFAGGWTIKAAERVCAGSDIEEPEVEELLTGLVEKSIVVFDVDGSRYRLLNTVRHYAEDRLLDSGETDTARARHRDFFLDLAERTNVALRGPHQWESLNDIDPENDNFRAALEWSLACGQAGTGLKLAAALGPFWDARGSLTEGRSVLERALEAGRTDVSPEVLGNALYWSGYLAFRETDYERSRERLEESLALCREAGDKLGTAMTLLGLGLVAEARGDDSSARTQFKRSLLLSQEIHDPWGEALVLGNLGHVARKQGNFEEARSFHERSLTILRQVRDSLDTARSIDDRMARVANDIGILAWEQADFEEAAARFEESLTIRRAHNDRVGIGITLSDLGKLAFAKGIYKEARALFEESLATRREILDKRGIAECLLFLGNLDRAEGNYLEATVRLEESLARSHSLGEHGAFAPCLEELARLAKDQGQLERAAKLFGAAERLRETIGPSRPPIGRGDYDHYVDDLRATPAWQEGQKMTPGQVTTFVLGVPGANPPDR